MARLLREVTCQGCGLVFWLCCACDRGQRYCSTRCREQARRESLRRDRIKYARSERGRLNNRLRQRRYRLRHGSRRRNGPKKRNGSPFPAGGDCDRLTLWPVDRGSRDSPLSTAPNDPNIGSPSGDAPQAPPVAKSLNASHVRVSPRAARSRTVAEEPFCLLCGRGGVVLRRNCLRGRFRWVQRDPP